MKVNIETKKKKEKEKNIFIKEKKKFEGKYLNGEIRNRIGYDKVTNNTFIINNENGY